MIDNLSLTVNDILNRNIQLNGENIALCYGENSISYAQLQERTNALAAWLIERGAKKGERFLIWSKNTQEIVECFFACAKLGLIAVPVNTRLAEGEVKYILEDVNPAFTFVDETFSENWFHGLNNKAKITIDEGIHTGAVIYDSIINLKLPLPTIEYSVNAKDPFLIIYTAAVDGHPKGAVLTHKNVIACNQVTKELLELNKSDVCGIFTPLYHIAGTSLLFSGLHHGLTNIILPVFDASDAVQKIDAHNISIFCSFSPMAKMILDESKKEEIPIEKHVRKIFGLDSPETIAACMDIGINWYGIYAQTEVTGVVAAKRLDQASEAGLIGYPSSLIHISLIDEDGKEVNAGEIGEICVRGETIFSHYWNKEKDNHWIFRGGWLHTGDLAMRDESGKLWFKGRKSEKELIKTGGENVYPAEVEQMIKKHPAVENVIVFGVADDRWLEAVKAVVKLKDNQTITGEEIQQFCRESLSAYKIPKIIQFVNLIPEKDGEIDRETVKKIYANH